MTNKIEKLQNIVHNGRFTISNKTENSFVRTPVFEFEKININSETENSILFISMEEAVNVIKESGVTMSKSKIENVLKDKIGDIKTEFRLRFF